MNIPALLALLCLLFFNAGCSTTEQAGGLASKINPYQTLPSDKSLLAFPQFVVTDDFNAGKLQNQRGAEWKVDAPRPEAMALTLEKGDARNPERGYALKASFNLFPAEAASFASSLERLDVSQTKSLIFKYRLQSEGPLGFHGKIEVRLKDWKNKTQVKDITNLLNANQSEWGEVILPMNQFGGVDLDQLSAIQFTVTAPAKELRGSLWIDELTFFGFGDAAFESNRDNLIGFPKMVFNTQRRLQLKDEKDDKKLLLEIAADTWKYFENARDRKNHLIVDHLRVASDAPLAADYTSPTNIAMDLMSIVAAMDLGFISQKQARQKAENILDTLSKMERYKGFFFNFYDTKKLAVTRSYISTVDSGWLAISLVVIRQAFGGNLARKASRIIDAFSFNELLDPENNQLVVGIDVPERNFGGYHYGMLATEARAISLYAIGKGNIPSNHWWFLYRTPPDAWKWQNQVPQGKQKVVEGIDYVQGYYEYHGKKFVPSWGGSLFEFLMPTLVLKERELAPNGLGLNNRIATEIQRDYALKEKKYPVWGISPASTSNGKAWRYGEYGIKELSVKGYPDRGVITPHASFLALDSLPGDALPNIRKFLDFEMYGEYGLYDSIRFPKGGVNPQYLALDQGMTLVAICNYLKGGAIQNRFHADPVGKKSEAMLMKESFFSD